MPLKNFTLKTEITENCYGGMILYEKVKRPDHEIDLIFWQKLKVLGLTKNLYQFLNVLDDSLMSYCFWYFPHG